MNENKAVGGGGVGAGEGETEKRKKKKKKARDGETYRYRHRKSSFERRTLMDVSCRSLRNRRERSREYSPLRTNDTARSTARQSDDEGSQARVRFEYTRLYQSRGDQTFRWESNSDCGLLRWCLFCSSCTLLVDSAPFFWHWHWHVGALEFSRGLYWKSKVLRWIFVSCFGRGFWLRSHRV